MFQPINEPTIVFDPVLGKLDLSLGDKLLTAQIDMNAVRHSKFALPLIVAEMLEPRRTQIRVRWLKVDSLEGVQALEAEEKALQECLAQAFYWATSEINQLDNVRRIDFLDLTRLSKACHGATSGIKSMVRPGRSA